jgi:hypothetical protein
MGKIHLRACRNILQGRRLWQKMIVQSPRTLRVHTDDFNSRWLVRWSSVVIRIVVVHRIDWTSSHQHAAWPSASRPDSFQFSFGFDKCQSDVIAGYMMDDFCPATRFRSTENRISLESGSVHMQCPSLNTRINLSSVRRHRLHYNCCGNSRQAQMIVSNQKKKNRWLN